MQKKLETFWTYVMHIRRGQMWLWDLKFWFIFHVGHHAESWKLRSLHVLVALTHNWGDWEYMVCWYMGTAYVLEVTICCVNTHDLWIITQKRWCINAENFLTFLSITCNTPKTYKVLYIFFYILLVHVKLRPIVK